MKKTLKTILLEICSIWRSNAFNIFTYRIGAYLLLLSGMFLPFGQHRFLLREFEDWAEFWFIFPVVWAFSAIGVFCFHERSAAILIMLLITSDAIQIPFLKIKK